MVYLVPVLYFTRVEEKHFAFGLVGTRRSGFLCFFNTNYCILHALDLFVLSPFRRTTMNSPMRQPDKQEMRAMLQANAVVLSIYFTAIRITPYVSWTASRSIFYAFSALVLPGSFAF